MAKNKTYVQVCTLSTEYTTMHVNKCLGSIYFKYKWLYSEIMLVLNESVIMWWLSRVWMSSVSLCLYLCSVFPQVRRFNLCLIWSSHSSTHTCFHIPPPILHMQSVCHAELFHSWGNDWKHELAWETWKVHSVLNTPGFTFTVIWPLSSLPFFCYYLYIYVCVCETVEFIWSISSSVFSCRKSLACFLWPRLY